MEEITFRSEKIVYYFYDKRKRTKKLLDLQIERAISYRAGLRRIDYKLYGIYVTVTTHVENNV